MKRKKSLIDGVLIITWRTETKHLAPPVFPSSFCQASDSRATLLQPYLSAHHSPDVYPTISNHYAVHRHCPDYDYDHFGTHRRNYLHFRAYLVELSMA